jgi:hypothetical protein
MSNRTVQLYGSVQLQRSRKLIEDISIHGTVLLGNLPNLEQIIEHRLR